MTSEVPLLYKLANLGHLKGQNVFSTKNKTKSDVNKGPGRQSEFEIQGAF